VKDHWDRFILSFKDIRKSPLRLAALIILAIVIFSVLIALIVIFTPKGTFEVECIQCGGRDGNLVIISGTQASFDVVVKVTDANNTAVENATVKIAGGDETASAKTDVGGMAVIHVNATIEQGEQSAFLKVIVGKSGFKKYVGANFIVVARE